jgi:hypothetical protein
MNGHIYLLTSESMPGQVWIRGCSQEDRQSDPRPARTASITAFDIVFSQETGNCVIAERLIHNLLFGRRVDPRRAVFWVSVSEAKRIVKRVVKMVGNMESVRVGKPPRRRSAERSDGAVAQPKRARSVASGNRSPKQGVGQWYIRHVQESVQKYDRKFTVTSARNRLSWGYGGKSVTQQWASDFLRYRFDVDLEKIL